MSTHNPKRDLFQQLARIGTALSSGTRLEFVELLAQRERSVDQLATLAGVAVANTSQHLQKLRQAGLVVGRKEGQYVYYRLAGDEVVRLLGVLGRVGEAHLAEVERIVRIYLESKDELEPVPAHELLERAQRGLVTVLDVRPAEEYAAGHVPGAVNIPIHELEKRLGELPKRKEIVAYCRGPYCLMSFDAVQLLRRKGLKARRLENGLPEWRLSGLPSGWPSLQYVARTAPLPHYLAAVARAGLGVRLTITAGACVPSRSATQPTSRCFQSTMDTATSSWPPTPSLYPCGSPTVPWLGSQRKSKHGSESGHVPFRTRPRTSLQFASPQRAPAQTCSGSARSVPRLEHGQVGGAIGLEPTTSAPSFLPAVEGLAVGVCKDRSDAATDNGCEVAL